MSPLSLRRLFLSGLLFFCGGIVVFAADWPIFRCTPGQTGIAPGKLPDKLEVLWEFKTKDGFENAAAVVNGVVYIGSYDQNLYALDLATGKQKWAYKAGPFKAPPGVKDGLVYIGDMDGMFHCVDAATGTKKWTYDTSAEISSGPNFFGDAVLFGAGDENLYCLRAGKEKWKFKVPGGPVMGSPAIIGNRTFAAGCDSNLHVIDLETGKEVSTPLELNGQIGATVAVVDDHLFVGNMSNQVLAIEWKKPTIDWPFEATQRAQPFILGRGYRRPGIGGQSRQAAARARSQDRQRGLELPDPRTRG